MMEPCYGQLQVTAIKSQPYLHVAAIRRQVKSDTLGIYERHQQSHVMLWHKISQDCRPNIWYVNIYCQHVLPDNSRLPIKRVPNTKHRSPLLQLPLVSSHDMC